MRVRLDTAEDRVAGIDAISGCEGLERCVRGDD